MRIDDASVSLHTPEYARTRDNALRRLTCLITDELKMNHRVPAGIDFPFDYPTGVTEHPTGKASALALWDWLAGRTKDEPNNANNRFEVAEKIDEAYDSALATDVEDTLMAVATDMRALERTHPDLGGCNSSRPPPPSLRLHQPN